MSRFLPIAAAALLLAGCQPETSDTKANRAQEQLANESVMQVGMPTITNFQEKRMAKQIIELRDKAITTHTYVVTLDGKLMKVCDSIGYGLPYATQFTSPSKIPSWGDSHSTALPQADPNGLFSPAVADGTWVMCVDPDSKKVMPLYIEPKVIVSPFPIKLTVQ